MIQLLNITYIHTYTHTTTADIIIKWNINIYYIHIFQICMGMLNALNKEFVSV